MSYSIPHLSTELWLNIAEIIYDDGSGHYSLRQLILVNRQIYFDCQAVLFKRAWLPLFTEPCSLPSLRFFTTRDDICSRVETLVIPIGERKSPISFEEFELLITLFEKLHGLKELSIGGDRYSYIYNPIAETAIPSLLAFLSDRSQHHQTLRIAVDWNGRSTADSVLKLSKNAVNLAKLTICPFKWHSSPTSPHLALSQPAQAIDTVITDFNRIIQYDPEIRDLHIAMINFEAKYTPRKRQNASYHRLDMAPYLLDQIGQIISNTNIDSLELDGVWSFQFAGIQSWPVWEQSFRRLRSLTISRFDAYLMLWRPLSRNSIYFDNLEEFRLSLNCYDHRYGGSSECTWDSCPAFWIIEFIEMYPLSHLTLCGVDKADFFQSCKTSSNTLRSLRIHISTEYSCSLIPLVEEDILRINSICPYIQWLGIDLPSGSLQCGDWQQEEESNHVLFSNFLVALSNFAYLSELSCFIEAYHGISINLQSRQVVKIYCYLEEYKAGCPFQKLTITCVNHVWAATRLSPSRVFLRSYSRSRQKQNYTDELWDTRRMIALYVETDIAGPPPKYEFGLSRWDIEVDPLGTGEDRKIIIDGCMGSVIHEL